MMQGAASASRSGSKATASHQKGQRKVLVIGRDYALGNGCRQLVRYYFRYLGQVLDFGATTNQALDVKFNVKVL